MYPLEKFNLKLIGISRQKEKCKDRVSIIWQLLLDLHFLMISVIC